MVSQKVLGAKLIMIRDFAKEHKWDIISSAFSWG
jgi:hypothetical protein